MLGEAYTLEYLPLFDEELAAATKWLGNELRITEKYTMDFSEDARKLNEGLRKIEEEIKTKAK